MSTGEQSTMKQDAVKRDAGEPAAGEPAAGPLTWRGAIGETWRSAARHKVAAAVIALCAVASLAGIALANLGPGRAGPAADPVAAAFSLPVLGHSGQQVSLADYSGRPVIVNFFASWCGPCQQETPLLAKFDRTSQVALVGLDENDVMSNAMSFTRAKGVSYPVGWDPHFIAANAYGVVALPQTFFLNAKHRIVDRIFGAVTVADLRRGIALATRS
jgi:cytochrome c biogenesis protein CcmG/thiol:disulfide interchange protein DsbE